MRRQNRPFQLLMRMRGCFFLVFLLASSAWRPRPAPPWLTLPATPTLPTPEHCGTAPVNGIKIWYAEFGRGEPVILLHGGLANADYWGNQVPVLAQAHQVIVMDSRGHGRSTRDGSRLAMISWRPTFSRSWTF